ncbi:MAG: alpha/beta hydrolase [Lacunisphaera sp.]|nr:alpha/beta hydrolase [Lacunisphaera sp.]
MNSPTHPSSAPRTCRWRTWLQARIPPLVLSAAVAALTGCSLFLPATPTPIPTRATRISATDRTGTLVVFLRGRGGSIEDFEKEGMLAALREAGVRADTVVVDAHLGYYFKRTAIERLRADVLQPARQQGYRRIVLVGVSLGGLGALLCERDHPGSVDALVLLGPYLGSKARLFDKIDQAGGPAAWSAGRDPRAGGVEEQIWIFLGTRLAALPPTWLLTGRSDPYARGHRLLGGMLPAARVATIAGGHDWATWRALWREACADPELFPHERTTP